MSPLRYLFLVAALAGLAPAGQIEFNPIPGNVAVLHVNNSGVSSGFLVDLSGPHAFVRDSAGTFTLFNAPGALFTEAVNVDESGVVDGNAFTSPTTQQIFRRDTDGSITILPPVLGALATEGGNTNASGTMVGAADNHAFIMPPGGPATAFDVSGAAVTGALGLNDAGVVVGYSQAAPDAPPEGFIRSAGGVITPYDAPGSLATLLYDINNAGDLAGTYLGFDGHFHGFVYRTSSDMFTTVDYALQNTTVFSINDNWQLAGASYDDGNFSTGPFAGFLATETPEPGTEMLTGLALTACAMVLRARRRRDSPRTSQASRER